MPWTWTFRIRTPTEGASLAACLMVLTACVGGGRAPSTPSTGALTVPREVRVRVGDRVQSVPLETYVVGTALSEFSPVGESAGTARRILEVQTVISRTYAVAQLGRHRGEGFDLCDTTHCQVYQPARITTSSFSGAAQAAARTTAGQVLLFDRRLAQTLFHADCGGHTADAADVWGGAAVPYLQGRTDEVATGTHRRWQFDVSLADLRAALNADSRTAVGRSLDAVRISRRDASGRAAELALEGETSRRVRGDQFRAVLNRAFGVRSVMSTRLSLNRDGDRFRLEGDGFGHGVGLCQVGAAARARDGASLEAILAAYYPGSQLARLPRR